jgi:hypothetical protein
MKGATTMFDIIKTNGCTTKRDALVKSVSAFAIGVAILFAGAPAALAAQDGIRSLITVQQMKAAEGAEGAEDLQAKEGQAEEKQRVEELQMMEMPSNEESQDLRSGTGKAQTQQLWRKQ